MKKRRRIKWFPYTLFLGLFLAGITQSGWMYQNDISYVPIQVQDGDTVWRLAAIASDNTTDVRRTVEAIMVRNHLGDNADIRPGQTIEIPVASDREREMRDVMDKRS